MTDLLKQAFERAAALPEWEQDELAAILMDAIESDQRWEAALAKDPGKLERLADNALEDIRAGRSEPLDPDKL